MKKKSSKSITNKNHNKNVINIHIGDKGKKRKEDHLKNQNHLQVVQL